MTPQEDLLYKAWVLIKEDIEDIGEPCGQVARHVAWVEEFNRLFPHKKEVPSEPGQGQ